MDSESEIADAWLDRARSRADSLASQVSTGGPEALAAFEQACDELLSAERAAAAAKGEEYAIPLALGVTWRGGAPLPHLVASSDRTLLAFYVERDPSWEALSVRVTEATDQGHVALVDLESCVAVKFGPPNDEALEGHRLYGRGLSDGEPAEVIGSQWIDELIEIERVHSRFNPKEWEGLRHFLFPFQDETVEAVAHGLNVTTKVGSLRLILAAAAWSGPQG